MTHAIIEHFYLGDHQKVKSCTIIENKRESICQFCHKRILEGERCFEYRIIPIDQRFIGGQIILTHIICGEKLNSGENNKEKL